jgi:hypothetical protein
VPLYDKDRNNYFEEISYHHGRGYDAFFLKEYDMYYGNKLVL